LRWPLPTYIPAFVLFSLRFPLFRVEAQITPASGTEPVDTGN
jgi:hypothetical protein